MDRLGNLSLRWHNGGVETVLRGVLDRDRSIVAAGEQTPFPRIQTLADPIFDQRNRGEILLIREPPIQLRCRVESGPLHPCPVQYLIHQRVVEFVVQLKRIVLVVHLCRRDGPMPARHKRSDGFIALFIGADRCRCDDYRMSTGVG